MARLTKKRVIDYILYVATRGLLFGDERDSKAPSITPQDFTQEVFRCGAKVLRTRLSGLSHQQVLQEGIAAFEQEKYAKGQALVSLSRFERTKREERMQANRRQLAEAMAAKRNMSQAVDDVVAELAGPLLNKRPKRTSHWCAVEIQAQLNAALRTRGHLPLKLDAIRKRVEKYRTHAR